MGSVDKKDVELRKILGNMFHNHLGNFGAPLDKDKVVAWIEAELDNRFPSFVAAHLGHFNERELKGMLAVIKEVPAKKEPKTLVEVFAEEEEKEVSVKKAKVKKGGGKGNKA